jgi:hypothetical protein
MSIIRGIDVVRSAEVTKRFGRPSGYGQGVYGISYYGYFLEHGGIYQIRTRFNRRVNVKEKYYWPEQKTEGPQEEARQKFIAGAAAWQALTDEQQAVWRAQAKGRPLTGWNLFIADYMKTA